MACQARTLRAITGLPILPAQPLSVRRSVRCGPLFSHLCMHVVTLCALPSRMSSLLLLPRRLSCHQQTSCS